MFSQLDFLEFTTEQAADIAGIPIAALKTRWQRSDDTQVRVDGIGGIRPGSGRRRTLSGRYVMHLALTETLQRLGLPLKTAFSVALKFTHLDDGVGGLVGEVIPPPTRLPGGLFPDDSTVFRVGYPADGGEPIASVNRGAEAAAQPFVIDSRRCAAVLSVDMDSFVKTTFAKMGIRS